MAKVIAEIGCSHLGDKDRALMLCKLAKETGSDYVKTQKRNPEESTPENIKHKPHPNPGFAYGSTYIEHRKALELPIEFHQELESYCDSIGIKYATSVWDMTSAKEIVQFLHSDLVKIPSAINTNLDMMGYLYDNFPGDIHISLGMTTREEEDEIVKHLSSKGRAKDVVIYHCTSAYPVDFSDACMLEITRLINDYGSLVKTIGFSDHTKGIVAPIVAVTLGVGFIEKHFIDDRTIRHTDASNSLELGGMKKMIRDIKHAEESLKAKNGLVECELKDREKMKFSK